MVKKTWFRRGLTLIWDHLGGDRLPAIFSGVLYLHWFLPSAPLPSTSRTPLGMPNSALANASSSDNSWWVMTSCEHGDAKMRKCRWTMEAWGFQMLRHAIIAWPWFTWNILKTESAMIWTIYRKCWLENDAMLRGSHNTFLHERWECLTSQLPVSSRQWADFQGQIS